MDVRGCKKCDDLGAWPAVVLTAIILFTLWMLYLFSWRPLVRERCKTCNYMGICSCCIGNSLRTEKMGFLAKALSAFVARLTSSSASGYFKIILSFWQLTGTYNLVYNVDWPKELSELWNLLSYFFQFDILGMPSVSLVHVCMYEGVVSEPLNCAANGLIIIGCAVQWSCGLTSSIFSINTLLMMIYQYDTMYKHILAS